MKKLLKITGITALVIGTVWTFLTVWVERTGPKRSWQSGSQTAKKRVLIVYDPDPIYNLDEQVSRSFGQALADQGMRVTVASVAAASGADNQVSVVAITLGGGSTGASQTALETLVSNKKANLLDSHSLWLLRPNDESRMQESNVVVAVSIAYSWGKKIAKRINAF